MRERKKRKEKEEREGGYLNYRMGEEMGSEGRVKGWEKTSRIDYEEDWEEIKGKDKESSAS